VREVFLDLIGMSKGRRKRRKEANKRQKLPTIASPSPKRTENTALPSDVAKLQPDRTVLTTKEIFITTPVESCFGLLAGQLEQPPNWDPMIVTTQPVSTTRGCIGATSQVSLHLGGRILQSLAVISRYQPKRSISWVLTENPKVREDWSLERKPHGTIVRVTLAHEANGGGIRRLLYKFIHWKKVEQDLDTMLTQLKAIAERGKGEL
jgi:hypothetical protein